MDEFSLLKQTLQAPKDKKGWLYTFLLIILILGAVLAIFWPSQKPVKAYETTQLYFASMTGEGIFTLLDLELYPSLLQTGTSSLAWGYDNTSSACDNTSWLSSGQSPPMFRNPPDYIVGGGSNDIKNYFWPLTDGQKYLCFNNQSLGLYWFIRFSRTDGVYSTDPYITGPSLTITSPPDKSTQTTAFDIVASYDILDNDYDRLMIILEDWDASSTCPIYGTEDFSNEYSLYFNSQSRPYFSNYFTTSTGIATTSISDLAKGNYRCTRCYFINESEGILSSEVCNGYSVFISKTISPTGIPSFYEGQDWTTFYSTHTEKWATSTELFNYLAEKTAPLLLWVGNFTADFKALFNNASSSEMGVNFGQAIPKARGYLTIINDWFGSLPLAEIFIFYILTALIIVVLKIVLMVWHFFRGGG